MAYCLIPKAFIVDSLWLYGPGRHDFGYGIHNNWIYANTTDDDPTAPESFVQVIGVDGLAAAYARLNRWMGTGG